MSKKQKSNMAARFARLLPVVIDVETAGLNPERDALLEIAAVTLTMDEEKKIQLAKTYAYHVEPFIGAHLDPEALNITKIDPFQPLRYAIPERQALFRIFSKVKKQLEETGCERAVLVGHNAWFDLAFMQAAMKRSHIKKSPFHAFTVFDTATLSAIAVGQTVLAKASKSANIPFNVKHAHSAIYDAERTAELFCHIVNLFNKRNFADPSLGGPR